MMHMTFTVGVRQYGDQLAIAQSLHAPFLSAAAESQELALQKLGLALEELLSGMHPTVLSQVIKPHRPESWHAESKQLPLYSLYSGAADLWFIEGESPSESSSSTRKELVRANLDLVTETLHDALARVIAPAFGAIAFGETAEDAEKTLLLNLQSLQNQTVAHRPPSTSWEITSINVSFTTLDLKKVSPDHLWRDTFSARELEEKPQTNVPESPTLELVAEQWSHLTQRELEERSFELSFARDLILNDFKELLQSSPPTPVVLVGPSRVGKTSLVKHLAVQTSNAQQERSLQPLNRLWFASPPRLCATDMNSQGWQMQCQNLFAELEAADDILYMGRLIEALDAGKYVGSDYNLAQFLKPLLADHRVRVVAEATVEEWNLIEQRDIGFARTFHVLRMNDLPEDISFSEIIMPASMRLAKKENINLEPDAVRRAWLLLQRFTSEGSTVGRTLDFISNVIRRAVSSYKTHISDIDVVNAFCDATGLPQFMLLDEHALDLNQVVSVLEQRVMGQTQAVQRVADVIGITKAGLAPPDRPLGSFLFVGPTGVGKTELAKALAAFLFGDEERLIRLDMSEYSHPNAYGRLIGEASRVRNLESEYSAGGDLTGPVRRQPFCVILLDEIEKAHASVFDLLLQVLGEARLTDVHGRTTRFQNTIVIMTSNLGVSSLRPTIGFASADEKVEWERHFRRESERFFRPEFLARINQIIPFQPLDKEVVEHIARRELGRLQQRDGLSRLDVSFSYDDGVEGWIARHGWSAQYGARPLKRLIDREIAAKLAHHIAFVQNPMEPAEIRKISLSVSGEDKLVWSEERVEASDPAVFSRRMLLELIQSIAQLRRKLQQYMYTEVYSDLEWEIENFDVSSQGEQFWQHPAAADIAARAERARRIVQPAEAMAQELGALEDLAHEAYYGHSFELMDDLTERLDELRPELRQIFLVILRSAFDFPDEVVLFLPSGKYDAAWRNTLARWYGELAKKLGLEVTAYSSKPENMLAAFDEDVLLSSPDAAYEKIGFTYQTFSSGAHVIALKFKGFAARPLLLGEDGLHRLIEPDGNAQVEVLLQEEHLLWPLPEVVLQGRPSPSTARVWNRRTKEVSVPYYASVPLDERDPWSNLLGVMEDVVWMIVESRWES